MITAVRRRGRTGVLLAFALFVVLGLPEGVLGTAWPEMRGSFDQRVSALAWLIALYTGGYLLSTLVSGHLSERFGIAWSLRAGVSLSVTGLALYAVSPSWPLVVMAAGVAGLGGGTVDATLNAYVAVVAGPRAMNLLHAMFGVGATIGPVLVTSALAVDAEWRLVYGVLCMAELAMLAGVIRNRSEFGVPIEHHQAVASRRPMPVPLLVMMLAIFFFYVGAEASYGQWTYSVLTDERGVGVTAAGWAVSSYWGGLTVGRLLLGFMGSRISPLRLLEGSFAAIVVGAAVFWTDPLPGLDLAALVWMGLAMAGVFPAMVLLTPQWLGAGNTGKAVGYQLAASSLGGIATSAATGLVVRNYGLERMPLVAFVVTVGAYAGFRGARFIVGRSRPSAPTTGVDGVGTGRQSAPPGAGRE